MALLQRIWKAKSVIFFLINFLSFPPFCLWHILDSFKFALMCLSLLNICDQTLGHTHTHTHFYPLGHQRQAGSAHTNPHLISIEVKSNLSLQMVSVDSILYVPLHQCTSKLMADIYKQRGSSSFTSTFFFLLYWVHVCNERTGTESIKRECDVKADDFWRSISFTRSFDVNDRKKSYKTYFS